MRRWLWLRLTPNGRMERAAARRYWRSVSGYVDMEKDDAAWASLEDEHETPAEHFASHDAGVACRSCLEAFQRAVERS